MFAKTCSDDLFLDLLTVHDITRRFDCQFLEHKHFFTGISFVVSILLKMNRITFAKTETDLTEIDTSLSTFNSVIEIST